MDFVSLASSELADVVLTEPQYSVLFFALLTVNVIVVLCALIVVSEINLPINYPLLPSTHGEKNVFTASHRQRSRATN